MADERDAAWDALHEALPAGWILARVTVDRAAGLFEFVAMSPISGRRDARPAHVLVGRGIDEPAALKALTEALREWREARG